MHDAQGRNEILAKVSGGGRIDPTLTEGIVAAHTIGPILYTRLFDRQEITASNIELTIDAFLAAFTP